jgi:glutamate dehydrogenase
MFKAKLMVIYKNINKILAGSVPDISYSKLFEKIKINAPDRLIDMLAERQFMLLSLNIVKISISCADIDILDIANVYVALKNELETFWLQEKINSLPISSNWHKIARSLIKNDLEWLERTLCVKLLKNLKKKSNVAAILNTWLSNNGEFCQRWKSMISEIRQAELVEFDIIYIIIRELFNVLDLN